VRITKGTKADLASLKLGDQAKGFTPYYVTFKVTNESGTDYSFSSLGLNSGLLADGSRAQKVSVIGKFKPCDGTSAPRSFTTKGASYTTCTMSLAGPGSSVTGAQFSGYNSDVSPDTDYGKDAITWS
jgi:hypothetical protein